MIEDKDASATELKVNIRGSSDTAIQAALSALKQHLSSKGEQQAEDDASTASTVVEEWPSLLSLASTKSATATTTTSTASLVYKQQQKKQQTQQLEQRQDAKVASSSYVKIAPAAETESDDESVSTVDVTPMSRSVSAASGVSVPVSVSEPMPVSVVSQSKSSATGVGPQQGWCTLSKTSRKSATAAAPVRDATDTETDSASSTSLQWQSQDRSRRAKHEFSRTITIPKVNVREVIGSQGLVKKTISEISQTLICIPQVIPEDSANVTISLRGPTKAAIDTAFAMIDDLVRHHCLPETHPQLMYREMAVSDIYWRTLKGTKGHRISSLEATHHVRVYMPTEYHSKLVVVGRNEAEIEATFADIEQIKAMVDKWRAEDAALEEQRRTRNVFAMSGAGSLEDDMTSGSLMPVYGDDEDW